MATGAETSVFRGSLAFFEKLGVYDVVLPFLLVFTLTYAILEKTAIFGKEKVEGKELTRKNLNGMTAFVMAFFVVASTKLVAMINKVLANVVMLLVLIICFLLLAGSFHSGKEEFFLKKGWKTLFMIISFVGIILIFLNAWPYGENDNLLNFIWYNIAHNMNSVAVSSIVLIVIIIVFMLYVTGAFEKKKESGEKED